MGCYRSDVRSACEVSLTLLGGTNGCHLVGGCYIAFHFILFHALDFISFCFMSWGAAAGPQTNLFQENVI